MIRAIDFVFEILPPEKEDIPSTDETVPATMLIQSFVINVQGCLDNLAWIWVFETGLKGGDGKELDRRAVGLGDSAYWIIRKSFSKPFQKYLKQRTKWFRHVAEFRDSLAHRIPLYVMPFILSEPNSKEYYRLEKEAVEAGLKGDYKAYDDLKAEQRKLGAYRPWMTHFSSRESPGGCLSPTALAGFSNYRRVCEQDCGRASSVRKAPKSKQHQRNCLYPLPFDPMFSNLSAWRPICGLA